jgi:hypothetical protein
VFNLENISGFMGVSVPRCPVSPLANTDTDISDVAAQLARRLRVYSLCGALGGCMPLPVVHLSHTKVGVEPVAHV